MDEWERGAWPPLIEAEFGITVHPRGLEKALERIQKKPLEPGP